MEERLEQYLSLLLSVNAHTNLTAIRTPEEIRVRHFEDSLFLLEAAELRGKALLDVGSGAGFPGLVLAIAVPEISVTLLEANGKKCAFLQRVISELEVSNARVWQGRAELLGHDKLWREQFDIVTARGVAGMEVLCELCLPFLKTGALFLAMKEREEGCVKLPLLGGTAEEAYRYHLSDGREHLVLRIRKTAPTELKYPRPWTRISKEACRTV